MNVENSSRDSYALDGSGSEPFGALHVFKEVVLVNAAEETWFALSKVALFGGFNLDSRVVNIELLL